MQSPHSNCVTSARPLSILDPRISIDELVLIAYFTNLESEVAARRRRMEALLRKAYETGSLTDRRAARSEYQAIREDFDPTFGPSQVKSIQAT